MSFIGQTRGVERVRALGAVALLAIAATVGAQPAAKAATVELRDVEETYAADAVVESLHQATVSAQIAGQLTQLYVDARVKRTPKSRAPARRSRRQKRRSRRRS